MALKERIVNWGIDILSVLDIGAFRDVQGDDDDIWEGEDGYFEDDEDDEDDETDETENYSSPLTCISELKENVIEALIPNEKGKDICDFKKQILRDYYRKYNIRHEERECGFDGECSGTCRKCDEESRKLLYQISPKLEFLREIDEIKENDCFGDIYRISRLRMGTDGKGISTLVCFNQCQLNCKYCINKNGYESSNVKKSALYSPSGLIEILDKDAIYFISTGGGVVFGGGEPLLQADFIHEVCDKIRITYDRRIETSLNVPWKNIEKVLNDIDLWIIDIKDVNSAIYQDYTGMDNRQVLDNIWKLVNIVGRDRIEIRVPRIPGYNDEVDINKTVNYVRRRFGIEPEVFSYKDVNIS